MKWCVYLIFSQPKHSLIIDWAWRTSRAVKQISMAECAPKVMVFLSVGSHIKSNNYANFEGVGKLLLGMKVLFFVERL